MEHLGALWWCNGQIETLAMGKLGPLDGDIGGPWPQILFKRFNTASLHSFELMAPRYWEILDVLQVEKNIIYMGPNSSLFVSYFKDCMMTTMQCMILVFSLIYLDSWVCMSLFSFSFFLFFLCLSLRGPFSSGPLEIVHPCHPVATPLLRGELQIDAKNSNLDISESALYMKSESMPLNNHFFVFI